MDRHSDIASPKRVTTSQYSPPSPPISAVLVTGRQQNPVSWSPAISISAGRFINDQTGSPLRAVGNPLIHPTNTHPNSQNRTFLFVIPRITDQPRHEHLHQTGIQSLGCASPGVPSRRFRGYNPKARPPRTPHYQPAPVQPITSFPYNHSITSHPTNFSHSTTTTTTTNHHSTPKTTPNNYNSTQQTHKPHPK